MNSGEYISKLGLDLGCLDNRKMTTIQKLVAIGIISTSQRVQQCLHGRWDAREYAGLGRRIVFGYP